MDNSDSTPPPERRKDVGYKRPPREHQFKPGQPSANPRGRPRGTRREHRLTSLLQKKYTIRTEQGVRRVAAEEAITLQLVHAAMKGDLAAIKLVLHFTTLAEKLAYERGPSVEEIIAGRKEAAEKARLSQELVKLMNEANDELASRDKVRKPPPGFPDDYYDKKDD